jgi:hypothetical protein
VSSKKDVGYIAGNTLAGSRLNTRPAFRPHRKTCTRERSHVGVLEARTSSPWVGVRLI